MAKQNANDTVTCRTQSRRNVSSGLSRVRELARKDKSQKFTALLHHVTVELLEESYYKIKHNAASGIDGVTWEEYGKELTENLIKLHARMHTGKYRAQPSRRSYIPKAQGCHRVKCDL